MAKYFGNIGFATQIETMPGVWEDSIEERPYKGDVLISGRRYEHSENVNDNLVITNRFSIISDAFLYDHFPAMRYLTHLGTKFKITLVEIERPRVIISVGGVYVSGIESDSSTGETGRDSGE